MGVIDHKGRLLFFPGQLKGRLPLAAKKDDLLNNIGDFVWENVDDCASGVLMSLKVSEKSWVDVSAVFSSQSVLNGVIVSLGSSSINEGNWHLLPALEYPYSDPVLLRLESYYADFVSSGDGVSRKTRLAIRKNGDDSAIEYYSSSVAAGTVGVYPSGADQVEIKYQALI